MSRSAQAFAAAENRVDRGRTKERIQAQREHFATVACSAFDGILGGYAPHLHADLIDHLLREGAARRKACTDGPAAVSILGDICKDLGADIEGPKAANLRLARAAFKTGGAE